MFIHCKYINTIPTSKEIRQVSTTWLIPKRVLLVLFIPIQVQVVEKFLIH